jgi:transposase
MRTIRHRRIRLLWSRDKAALRAEARTNGIFPLVTNQEGTSKREVLEIYKFQPYIEKRFSLTKSEFAIAPIFLKKPRRVAGLIHLYFIAIMCSALIERQVRSAMRAKGIQALPILPEGRMTTTPTTPRILENFDDVAWHEFREGERAVAFPVQLNSTQEQLLDLAGVPRERYA